MDLEVQYRFVTICFPAVIFSLIVTYLYLKDRSRRD
jgi:hypothetical protein